MEKDKYSYITENAKEILRDMPSGVTLSAAAKTRSAEEISAVIKGGVEVIGQNYVQEAEDTLHAVSGKAELHLIGHLQRNKVNKAVHIFDMIETVDSYDIADAISKKCEFLGKIMPVLIEVNSGHEEQKNGIVPEDVLELIKRVASLPGIKVKGLMTIGLFTDNAEEIRGCFRETKRLFDDIKVMNIPKVEMEILSMGMSASYKKAIEEGANMVRIGSKIFGPRRVR